MNAEDEEFLIRLQIRETLRKRIKASGKTQAEVAKAIDVNPNLLSRTLNHSDNDLTLDLIARIGVAIGERFELSVDENPC